MNEIRSDRQTCLTSPTAIAPGSGGLMVEQVTGQSAVTSAYAANPLKLLVPRARGRSVWAYLSNFGGGMVAGDQTRFQVSLAPHTRCFLSTQAATKIYRNPDRLPCSHEFSAHVASGALLALVPEPVQAFAGSSYVQRQQFFLQPDSGLVLVDWICSGRPARGERWAFTRLQCRNEVLVGPARLLLDSLLLDPADGALESAHRMGRFNCLALLLILGEPLRTAANSLLSEVQQTPTTHRGSLLRSASPVGQGALLRLAGEQVEWVAKQIQHHLAFLREWLHDDPWARKW